MKTLFKMLPALALILLSASCLAQKGAADQTKDQTKAQTKEVVSEVLYDQAIKALDDHQFIIRAEQLYFPDGRSNIKTVNAGYLSMQGSEAALKLDYTAFVNGSVKGRVPNFEDNAAEITSGILKKNGDTQYTLTIKSDGDIKETLTLLITVYKKSNQCSVKVDSNAYTQPLVTIKGRIYPLKEGETVE